MADDNIRRIGTAEQERRRAARNADEPVTNFSNGVNMNDAAASMLDLAPAGSDTGGPGEVSLDGSAPLEIPTGSTSVQNAADSMLMPLENNDEDADRNSPVTGKDDSGDDGPIDVGEPASAEGSEELDDQQSDSDEDGDKPFDIEDALFTDLDDQGSDDGDDEQGPLDISEIPVDTVMTITVNDKKQDVTLADLIKSYNGTEAIDKRLQETSERRKATDKIFQTAQQVVEQSISIFQNELFTVQAQQPDPQLATTNPDEYNRQIALYNAEAELINGRRTKMQQALQQVQAVQQQDLAARRQQAAVELHEKLPVLRDPVKGPEMQKAIIETATSLGYSNEQIAECTDPGLFYAMALASATLKRMNATKVRRKPSKARSQKQSSGRKRDANSAGKRNDQQRMTVAAKSGKWQDVADTILVQS